MQRRTPYRIWSPRAPRAGGPPTRVEETTADFTPTQPPASVRASRGRRAAPVIAALTFVATLVAGLAVSVLVPATASATTTGKAYVVNQFDNTVTPIDLATNTAGTPISVGHDSERIAITPNGTTAYVTSRNDSTVTPIDLATNTAGTPILVGGNGVQGIAITPNGATVYVTADGGNTVIPITVATNTVGTPITVGNSPNAVAITPNGATAYVTNLGDGTVTPITVATNTPGAPITVGNQPYGIAITPNGATAYVVNQSDSTVTPITVATNTAGTPIPVNASAEQVAFTPDGTTAYVTNLFENTVTPITVATNTVGAPITVGNGPTGIAIVSPSQPTPTPTPSMFPFSGFFPPVANLPTENSMNAGRAVPVKFSLGGNQGLNIFNPGFPASQQINCQSGVPIAPIEQTVTAGNSSLQYDPVTGQYTYVWKTDKAWSGTCRQLTVQLTDGTNHQANFLFK